MRIALILAQALLQSSGNELLQTLMIIVIGGGIFLGVGFMAFKWMREKPVTTASPSREQQERAQREIAQARLQGVLTLQFVFSPDAWGAIADRLASRNEEVRTFVRR